MVALSDNQCILGLIQYRQSEIVILLSSSSEKQIPTTIVNQFKLLRFVV
jgi:hypothetical protein